MTTFQTSRVLPHTPATIYGAFSDPAKLGAWWGPRGFSSEFASFDFVPGGRWVFTLIGPDGTRYPNENVFAVLEPGSRVVVRHAGVPHAFTLTITLAPHDDGTLLSWAQAFDDDAEAAAVEPFVKPANEQNLDRLTAVLDGRTPE